MLKKALIFKFFKYDYFDKVIRRINYYDIIIREDNEILKLPEESCLEKIYRLLIKREPPPYYSDYREIGTDVTSMHDYLIYTTRMKYGYSRRLTTPNTSFTTSDENSHEFHHNSSTAKNNTKISIQSPNMLKLTLQKRTHSNQVVPSTKTSV